jgi:hypothetical protein
MFSFASKLLAFVLIVQICTSQQSEQSSLLRCLTGYKDRYEIEKFFLFVCHLMVINDFFLVMANFPIVPQIEFFRNVLAVVLKHAKIHM